MKCAEVVFTLPPRDARVVKDMTTGKSKGYGFVSFCNKLVRLQRKNTDWRLCTFLYYYILKDFKEKKKFFCGYKFSYDKSKLATLSNVSSLPSQS